MESAGITMATGHGEWHPSHSPIPVLRVHGDGTLLYANDAAAPLLRGWSVSVGDPLPADWATLVARVLCERETFETELSVGEQLYLLTITPTPDQGGVYIHGYDITRRMRDLRDLEEREDLFRRAFHTSPDAVNINRLSDGLYIDVNQGFSDLTGFTREDVIGRTSAEIDIWADPDDRLRLVEGLRASGFVRNLEARFRRKDGTMRAGLMSAQLIQVGGTPHILSITRDIEEFAVARRALRESETRMLSLQENLPLGLYRSTRDGHIVYANNAMARMFGYDDADDLCRASTEALYVDPDDRERVMSVLEKHGLVKDWEVRLRHRDGSTIVCALNIRAVYDSEGRLVLQDGIVADITERKRIQEAMLRAKEQAEEANRIKSNFLATMSHELRTPLNGILGFANLLAEALGDNNDLREMAEIIHVSGHRLLDTLNSILDLSIVEAGRLEVQTERIDVATVVKESAMLYSASAKSKGLELRSSLPDPALEVVTDERLLRQILNNLINNAIKYTWEGSVTLVAESVPGAANEAVRIHIADTGIGISQKDQQVIFDEFRQASEGYSRAYDGSGLGLSVSQKFAHVLGGRISLVSVPGKGSCFTLHLPSRNL